MQALISGDTDTPIDTIVLETKGIFSELDNLVFEFFPSSLDLALNVIYREELEEDNQERQIIHYLNVTINSHLLNSLIDSYILDKECDINSLSIYQENRIPFNFLDLSHKIHFSVIDVFSESEYLFNKLDFIQKIDKVNHY